MNAERPNASPGDPADAEELSALMDGELAEPARARHLDGLCADARARGRWTLWHCASDALRSSEVAALHSERFAARVRSALEAEPPLLAPRALRHGAGHGVRPRQWALPLAAVAAAAAVLAVVALPQLRGVTAPSDQLAGATAPAAPMFARQVVQDDVIRAVDLEMYLAAHREQSATAVMPRSAPYLRTSVQAREVRP